MPHKLDPAIKAARAAAAAAKKEMKAKAAAEKKVKSIGKLMASEAAKLEKGGLTPSHLHIVTGRIRALNDRLAEAKMAL